MIKNKKYLILFGLMSTLVVGLVSVGVYFAVSSQTNNGSLNNDDNVTNPDTNPELPPTNPDTNPDTNPETPPSIVNPQNIEDFFTNFKGDEKLLAGQDNFFNRTNTFKRFESKIIDSYQRNIPPKSTLEEMGFDPTIAFPYPGNWSAVKKLNDENFQARLVQYNQLVKRAGFAFQENLANSGKTQANPFANEIRGKIPDQALAVTKEITLDPKNYNWLNTGLFLPPGEVLNVEFVGLSDQEVKDLGLYINIGFETRIWPHRPKLKLGRTFQSPSGVATQGQIAHNNLKLSQDFGGYIAILNSPRAPLSQFSDKPIKIRLSGAIEALNFTLGQTTKQEWEHYQDLARNNLIAPSVMLQNDYITIVGSLKHLSFNTPYEDVVRALKLWQDLITVSKYFNYKDYQNDYGHQFFQTSLYTVTSLAVNLGNGQISAPASWLGAFINYKAMLKNGAWGNAHEINHSHQSVQGHNAWGSDKGGRHGEVTNNSLSILSYMLLTNISQKRRAIEGHNIGGWPSYTDAYYSVGQWLNATHHKDNLNKQSLSFYTTLQHNFGPYTYLKAFRSYNWEGVTTDERKNKASYWVYKMSLALKMDLRDYYAQVGAVNLNEYTNEQKATLATKNFPVYHPLGIKYASAYAYPGHHFDQSSSPYAISPYGPTLLDLNKWTMHDEDIRVAFKDAKIAKGTLVKNAEGIYLYTPHLEGKQVEYRTDDLLTFKVDLFDKTTNEFLYTVDVQAKLFYDKNVGTNFTYGSYQRLTDSLGSGRIEGTLKNLRTAQEITYSEDKKFITNPTDERNLRYDSGGNWETFIYKMTFVAPAKGLYQFRFWGDDGVYIWQGDIDLRREPDKKQPTYNNKFQIVKEPQILEKGQKVNILALIWNAGGASSFHLEVKENDKSWVNALHNEANIPVLESPIYNKKVQEFIPPTLKLEPLYSMNRDVVWKDLKNLPDFSVTYDGPVWSAADKVENIYDQNNNTYFHADFNKDNSIDSKDVERVIEINFGKEVSFNTMKALIRGNTGNGNDVNPRYLRGEFYNPVTKEYEAFYEGEYRDFKTFNKQISAQKIRLAFKSRTGAVVIKELKFGTLKRFTNHLIKVDSPLFNYLEGNWSLEETGLVNNKHAELSSPNGTVQLWTKGKDLSLYLSNFAKLQGTLTLKVDGEVKTTIDFSQISDDKKYSTILPFLSLNDLNDQEHRITLEFANMQGIHLNLAEADSPNLYNVAKDLTISKFN